MKPNRIGQIGIPAAIISIVAMMVVPIPAAALDFLLVINLAGGVVILLSTMFVQRALDFSVFPSLLLVATMFRLALNVSSVRLVLLDGYAGEVIESFGHVVIGGSLVVGLVIFLILVVIQFVVITNGAGRVAEVGARFTLDAMPGKQMAIDADLAAGLITDDEARRRRREVAAEADFYGAMDGASKFVKGDAIAAIVITVINLIGGFIIGVMQRGMSMSEAAHTYSLLTVGDGSCRRSRRCSSPSHRASSSPVPRRRTTSDPTSSTSSAAIVDRCASRPSASAPCSSCPAFRRSRSS